MNSSSRESANSETENVISRLSAWADHSPYKVAIVASDAVIAYGDLNDRSNRLAELIREAGIDSEMVVGVCLARGIDLVVSMLAVWKAGGVYLPIDPDFPQGRIRFMVDDSKAKLVITETNFAHWFAGSETLILNRETKMSMQRWDIEKHPVSRSPYELAYIIYTSGSTGRPKGVMVEHASLANFSNAVGKLAAPAAERKAVWLTSVSFDMSFKAISLLFHGGVLHVLPDELRADPAACVEYMNANQIDLLPCTPSLATQLIDADLLNHAGTKERPLLLWLGGEPISEQIWALLREASTIRALNMYGPTECTIDATTCWLDDEEQPNIGKPMDNTQVYLLDPSGAPVKLGAVGEIYIGGIGVARGYVNQPTLTADRFVADTLGDSGSRLYRTGDLGRRRLDGTIKFTGRIDGQVKIRGYRVELGEIETCLRQYHGVEDAIAVASPHVTGELRLHAYLTGETILVEELRSALSADLPEYMIPSAFKRLERLPLNANGKVDRKFLEQHVTEYFETERPNFREVYAGPRTQVEEEICAAWREVLHIEKVGVHDDFFAIGGHSLLAVRIVVRLRRSLESNIPVRFVFTHRTIADLASAIEADGHNGKDPPRAGMNVRGPKVGVTARRRTPYFFWIPRPARSSPAAIRLFCLPHAGGDVTAFAKLAQHLPDGIEMWAIHLPGRGTRSNESVPNTFHDLVRDLSTLLRNYIDGPFALFGQSFGGIVAYEICHLLVPDLDPALLGIAAVRPPHLLQPVDRLSRADLVKSLRSQNRVKPEVLNDPELAESFVSAIDEDRRLLGTYTKPHHQRLRCQIQTFIGDKDHDISLREAAAWSDYTTGAFGITTVKAGHLVVPEESRLVADTLGMQLRSQ